MIERPARPHVEAAEPLGLDFWIGDWSVTVDGQLYLNDTKYDLAREIVTVPSSSGCRSRRLT